MNVWYEHEKVWKPKFLREIKLVNLNNEQKRDSDDNNKGVKSIEIIPTLAWDLRALAAALSPQRAKAKLAFLGLHRSRRSISPAVSCKRFQIVLDAPMNGLGCHTRQLTFVLSLRRHGRTIAGSPLGFLRLLRTTLCSVAYASFRSVWRRAKCHRRAWWRHRCCWTSPFAFDSLQGWSECHKLADPWENCSLNRTPACLPGWTAASCSPAVLLAASVWYSPVLLECVFFRYPSPPCGTSRRTDKRSWSNLLSWTVPGLRRKSLTVERVSFRVPSYHAEALMLLVQQPGLGRHWKFNLKQSLRLSSLTFRNSAICNFISSSVDGSSICFLIVAILLSKAFISLLSCSMVVLWKSWKVIFRLRTLKTLVDFVFQGIAGIRMLFIEIFIPILSFDDVNS